MQEIKKFNLRVYGLLIRKGQVLVTDEHRGGVQMTKFPGGGLEKGEGIGACLVREFREELDVLVTVGDFYYVNDFLQISAFNKTDQLISFYYLVEINDTELSRIKVVSEKKMLKADEQNFRWVKLGNLKVSDFTFPIDKVVCEKLRLQR